MCHRHHWVTYKFSLETLKRWSRRKVSKIRIQPANDPRVSRNVGIDVRSLNRETVLKMDRSRIRSTTGCVLCTVACSTYVRLKIWDTATRFDSRRLIKHSEASRRYELDATTHACASIITELVINLNQPSSQDNAISRVNSTNKLFIRIHFLSPFFLFFFCPHNDYARFCFSLDVSSVAQ